MTNSQTAQHHRAVVITESGPPKALQVATVATPVPQPGDVLVDVAYAGVNFAEIQQRRGDYPTPSLPFTLGLEVSGQVAAVGDGVTDLLVGEPVAAFSIAGGYAQKALIPAARVFALRGPLARAKLTEAAAVITAGTSAVAMLEGLGAVGKNDTVVVTAAAGGVGSMVPSIARMLGAGTLVGAVGSSSKIAAAKEFGYDEVVLYSDLRDAVLEQTGGRGAQIVLDSVGGRTFDSALASLAPLGRLVRFGKSDSGLEEMPAAMELVVANKSILGWSSIDLAIACPNLIAPFTYRALEMLADGIIAPAVSQILPLASAAEAHRLLESRSTTGKLLLDARAE